MSASICDKALSYDFSANATAPFRHLSSSNYLTASKFRFNFQRHVSADRKRRNVGGVRIAASLWPNPAPPVVPGESNGALEANGAVVDSRYDFLKCDGSKAVHSGTCCLLAFITLYSIYIYSISSLDLEHAC